MTTIRQMREADADAVRQVEAIAFGAWWRQLQGGSADRPPRTRQNVLASLGIEPQGCFVADEVGQVVGSVFSRTWGAVGWLGSLVVLPEYQGRGIGKRLAMAALEYLGVSPARVIGLETMHESAHNLGLYWRLGLEAWLPTLLLSKELSQSAGNGPTLRQWSSLHAQVQQRWLADLREATGQIWPGVDYGKEISATAAHGLGDTLVLTHEDAAIGLSVLRLASIREGESTQRAGIRALALHPQHTDRAHFRALLEASEGLARAKGKRVLGLSVNACYTWAVQHLLQWGYRLERAMLRMVLRGADRGPRTDECVDLSRWAG
jgi:ribosomal protein S18 acetylase RimI-like enzyme